MCGGRACGRAPGELARFSILLHQKTCLLAYEISHESPQVGVQQVSFEMRARRSLEVLCSSSLSSLGNTKHGGVASGRAPSKAQLSHIVSVKCAVQGVMLKSGLALASWFRCEALHTMSFQVVGSATEALQRQAAQFQVHCQPPVGIT